MKEFQPSSVVVIKTKTCKQRWARHLNNAIYNGILTIISMLYTYILYEIDIDVSMTATN